MIDRNALRGVIAARAKTQKDVAIHMGITPKTFYEKMKKGIFGSDEIEKMTDYLAIENPTAIFFRNGSTDGLLLKFLLRRA